MPVMIQYGTKMVDPSRYVAVVDGKTCSACGTCEDRCYFSAIAVDAEKGQAVVDNEKCMGCGVCEVTCPEEAITLTEAREAAFIPA